MADKVLFQTNDALDEQNLTQQHALANSTDYVERGLGFAVDYTNNTLDIGSGLAIIQNGDQAWFVLPDARSGLSLPATSGVNYVYLEIDPATDDSITYHIDTDDTAPANPSLKVGEVDTANDTSTELNRLPEGAFEALSAGSLDTDSATTKNKPLYDVTHSDWGAVGDGSADDTTPISDAITAANNAGGGVVYFPNGDYRITSTITLPNNVSLKGDGWLASTIQAEGVTAFDGSPNGIEVQNLGLVDTMTATDTAGFDLNDPMRCTFNRVRVHDFGKGGIWQMAGLDTEYKNIHLKNNGSNTSSGVTPRSLFVRWDSSTSTLATTVTLQNCYAVSGSGRAFEATKVDTLLAQRNIAENHSIAYYIQGTQADVWIDNYEEANSNADPVQVYHANPIWIRGRGAEPTYKDLSNLAADQRYAQEWAEHEFYIRDLVAGRSTRYGEQRGSDPSTSELDSGEVAVYVSNGSTGVTGAAGDLVYAVNDAGTIKTLIIAAKSNAT